VYFVNDMSDLTDDEFDEACLRLAMGTAAATAPVSEVAPDEGRHTDNQLDDRLLAQRQGPRADAVRQLRDELASAQTQVRTTTDELDESKAELEALRAQVTVLARGADPADAEQRRSEFSDLRLAERDRVLRNGYDEREILFQESVAAAESRATELAAALARSEALVLRLAGEADELREQLAQREDDLSRREEEVAEIQAVAEERVAGLRGQIALLKDSAKGHQLDVAAVADDISLRDREIRSLREEVARLRIVAAADSLEAAKRRESQLLDVLAVRDREILELREDLIGREERHAMEVTSIVEQFTRG
jgi:septal ring factor EnvC (AmiA/AmiB activator)